MAKKLGYKPSNPNKGKGSFANNGQKKGRNSKTFGKEKSTPLHPKTFISKAVDSLRKSGRHAIGYPQKSGYYGS